MPDRRKVLILDFDGTICRGDAPVRDYAERVAAELEVDAARRFRDSLDAFLDDGQKDAIPGARDGYDAVTRLGTEAGVSHERVIDMFLTTRRELTDGRLPIEVPANLKSFLHDISVNTRIVVVTNAPVAGLDSLLDRMGVRDLLDEAVGDARKPDGMGAIVDRLLNGIDAGQEPWRLFSVGDIWENDLRTPSERGCATGYIDRFRLGHGQPTVAASSIEELYERIQCWAGEMSDDALRRVVYQPLSGR